MKTLGVFSVLVSFLYGIVGLGQGNRAEGHLNRETVERRITDTVKPSNSMVAPKYQQQPKNRQNSIQKSRGPIPQNSRRPVKHSGPLVKNRRPSAVRPQRQPKIQGKFRGQQLRNHLPRQTQPTIKASFPTRKPPTSAPHLREQPKLASQKFKKGEALIRPSMGTVKLSPTNLKRPQTGHKTPQPLIRGIPQREMLKKPRQPTLPHKNGRFAANVKIYNYHPRLGPIKNRRVTEAQPRNIPPQQQSRLSRGVYQVNRPSVSPIAATQQPHISRNQFTISQPIITVSKPVIPTTETQPHFPSQREEKFIPTSQQRSQREPRLGNWEESLETHSLN